MKMSRRLYCLRCFIMWKYFDDGDFLMLFFRANWFDTLVLLMRCVGGQQSLLLAVIKELLPTEMKVK